MIEDNSAKMACFIKNSSPQLSQSPGSIDMIWSVNGAIFYNASSQQDMKAGNWNREKQGIAIWALQQ